MAGIPDKSICHTTCAKVVELDPDGIKQTTEEALGNMAEEVESK
jgi:hypothetical protein